MARGTAWIALMLALTLALAGLADPAAGQALTACTDHGNCSDTQYCETFGTCHACSWKSTLTGSSWLSCSGSDAIGGVCPPKCQCSDQVETTGIPEAIAEDFAPFAGVYTRTLATTNARRQ